MNSISISGRIGKGAEMRSTSSSESVATFSLADDQGRDKPPIWWRCQLWGKRAEALAGYLTKGASVTVIGRVQESEYTNREGQPRKSMDVRVIDIALQGGRQDGQAPASATLPAPTPHSAQGGGTGFDEFTGPFPF